MYFTSFNNKINKKGYVFDIYSYVGYKLNIYLDVNYSLIKWSNCGSPERISS